ncbi:MULTISPECIES: hypothetical protein [unclassified Enterococcus]|uniref:hypothetical protein n=1 Tax=unclassified Enterococcus TaxID=2608891 RepID=UPI003F28CA4F
MNEKEIAIKKWLCNLLDKLYLDANAYKSFFIRILPKERKRTVGNYFPVERVIEISNLLRDPEIIALTTIKLLAKHIVVVNKELFEQEEVEETICKELLSELLKEGALHQIELEGIVTTGNLENEISMHGDVSIWVENMPKEVFCILVQNSYSIKGELRKSGYKWLSSRQAWAKSYQENTEIKKEKNRLWALSSEVDIRIETPIQCLFSFDYFLAVKSDKNQSEELESIGFLYENYDFKKKYVKRVPVKNFSKERERLAKLEIPFELVVPKERQVIY